jgi:transcriptional regulator with XRE-family HTH domain
MGSQQASARQLAARPRTGTPGHDYQDAISEIGRIRKEAIDYLRSQGMTLTEIADKAGISRSRLSQLSTTRRAPERVLFTEGAALTLAVDTKQEEGTGRTVVHQEHAAAVEAITRISRKLGLDVAGVEYIVPPGMVDLNRDGLVVVCGPRRSPIIAQMLGVDERYGFENDEKGWYLVDRATRTTYRSPEDSGTPGDYAYLGRLPRPDGRGHWLYMAGIHSPGGEGAALYLERELEHLYKDAKSGRWSCLVECQWDPATHKMTDVSLLAPIHGPGKTNAGKRRD